ncbi:CRISPR-associated protein, Cmr1 family [Rubrobacter xylanophilus DSM 9941]|uniref:CRISPR-associated protein, Cmr1 family n=1 Tax=Rubrobacter xylanophilus (strain DSM 9941 / JCM 11954 / NBRC 16129 / PRD-1) TaxID=266117 RepID=Q1AZD7_RUBXD|nr:type III-B CRISPR module RAMP protein Cmr1 [Rubrobacter xylanophilus]ABG03241.1 CRISPR-associated protein, Cmr1 family [Rubrobacter xylanophilus DSM 9941]
MEQIEATFRVVTPMFMSGADQSRAELRMPSIKGALRFWWRALAWGRHGDLKKIREEEARLFGSTDEGQSKILISVAEANTSLLPAGTSVNSGLAYLGYGITEYRSQAGTATSREAIKPDSRFVLRIALKEGDKAHKDSVLEALWFMSHFGGLGSRSRRGFGSVIVSEMKGAEHPEIPSSTNELKKQIERKLKGLGIEQTSLPDYSAFSRQTRVVVWPLHTTSWEQALRKVGERLNAYRSSRQEKNFLDDRDLIRDYAFEESRPAQAPRRSSFGLPHNYYFIDAKTAVPISGPSRERDRRASPLFIHFHRLANEDMVAVLSLIPARFLPEGSKVRIGPAEKREGGRKHILAEQIKADPPGDFEPVEQFLSSLSGEASEIKA